MSGGCCSPLGPGTGPVAAFYQTILDGDGAALPQEPALQVINGDLADNPGVATELTLHYQFWQDSDGDLPQRRAVKPNSIHFDTTDDAGGDETRFALHSPIAPTVGLAPFKGDYWVDPSFVGTSTGSQSNPFTSFMTPVTGAFAAAIALGVNAADFTIPAGVTITENIVFPDTGGNWEIKSDTGFDSSTVGPRITGTVTATSTNAAITSFRLSNLIVNGNISGNTSAGVAELVLRSVRHVGTVTLTVSGTGAWVTPFKGEGTAVSNKIGGSHTGLVSVPCAVLADAWVFVAGFSDGGTTGFNPPQGSQLHDCQLGDLVGAAVPIGLNGVASNFTRFLSCFFNGPTTITLANANHTILMDPASYASLMAVGVTLAGAGAATAKIQVLGGGVPNVRTIANNLGSTSLGARAAPGLYELVFDMTLLAAGTAGTAQLNVIYTDMTGTLVTVAVGVGLLVTSAVGTKVAAVLPFQHNGAAAPIAISVTGVTTAGALSIALGVVARLVS